MATANNGNAMALRANNDEPITLTDAPMSNRPAGIVPTSVAEAAQLAEAFARSGMFATKTPQAALTILLTGMELGLMPAQAFRSIHVIEGKPSLSADAMIATCIAYKNVCEYFVCTESSASVATYETRRTGHPHPTTLTFTLDDAARAGLAGKSNWKNYPAQMLRARCVSGLARMVYPDVLLGLYTPEEIESIEPVKASRAPQKKEESPRETTVQGSVTENSSASDELKTLRSKIIAKLGALDKQTRDEALVYLVSISGDRNVNKASVEHLNLLDAEVDRLVNVDNVDAEAEDDESDPFADMDIDAEAGADADADADAEGDDEHADPDPPTALTQETKGTKTKCGHCEQFKPTGLMKPHAKADGLLCCPDCRLELDRATRKIAGNPTDQERMAV